MLLSDNSIYNIYEEIENYCYSITDLNVINYIKIIFLKESI